MKFSLYKYRKQAIPATAIIAAVAAVGTYFAVSGNAQPAAAGKPAATKAASAGEGAQFVTKSKASATPSTTKGSPKATPSAKHSGKATPSTEASPKAIPSTALSSSSGSRSPYAWPFSWDSIWNIPIASTATYAAANITSAGTYEESSESDYDSVEPTFPMVTLQDARLASGGIGTVSVHGDPAMTANGEWNTCSAFLGADNTSVYQGQTTELTAGGNPSFGGIVNVAWSPVDIEGTGTAGCHGGSGLSGLGGTLTLTDLTQSAPITHALKIALDGLTNYSSANGGFRWPATNADSGYNVSGSDAYYGGSNPNVQEGSLLALPKSISASSFSNPTVAKLAQAMQDYGAYIVDDTGSDSNNFSTLITNYNAWSQLDSDLCSGDAACPSASSTTFASQLDNLIQDLAVVTNNTASTPGGGAIGASRCAPYAPQFDGGSDAPPAVTVVNC